MTQGLNIAAPTAHVKANHQWPFKEVLTATTIATRTKA